MWVMLKHFFFLHWSDGGAVISQGKASDRLLLRGNSNENASMYAVVAENDVSLIVSLNKPTRSYVDSSLNTAEVIVLKQYCETHTS